MSINGIVFAPQSMLLLYFTLFLPQIRRLADFHVCSLWLYSLQEKCPGVFACLWGCIAFTPSSEVDGEPAIFDLLLYRSEET
jgi:hypothetical protein